jgi:2-haloacid dehalogenase
VFNYAIKEMGTSEERLLHVAQSIYHDHVPARELGLSTVWINRRSGKQGGGATPPAVARPNAEFPDLASMVKEMNL